MKTHPLFPVLLLSSLSALAASPPSEASKTGKPFPHVGLRSDDGRSSLDIGGLVIPEGARRITPQ